MINPRESPPDAAPDASGERSTERMGGQYSTTPPEFRACAYRLPYTPTGDSTCSFISNQRSGRNTCASGPHKSWFLPRKRWHEQAVGKAVSTESSGRTNYIH